MGIRRRFWVTAKPTGRGSEADYSGPEWQILAVFTDFTKARADLAARERRNAGVWLWVGELETRPKARDTFRAYAGAYNVVSTRESMASNPKKSKRAKRRPSTKRKRAARKVARVKRNAPSQYMGRCTRIEYVNVGDGEHYYHDFGKGVGIWANEDGTVVLMGKKPLVGERVIL